MEMHPLGSINVYKKCESILAMISFWTEVVGQPTCAAIIRAADRTQIFRKNILSSHYYQMIKNVVGRNA